MKLTNTKFNILPSLLAPLLFTGLANVTSAQDKVDKEKSMLAEDTSELLKKGNTWSYAVQVRVPDSVDFKPSFKDLGEKVKGGTLYKYEEMLQSQGLKYIKAIDRKAPHINIYVDSKLSRTQVLEYKDETLLYYGTFIDNPEKPELKQGLLSISPIPLYFKNSKVAQKWEWAATNLPTFQFRIVAKNSKVEVSKKTYIADKIQMDQIIPESNTITMSKEIWFADNVGIIKEREKTYTADGQAIIKSIELKSFKNNNKE